jgi:hypothetical protein
MTAAVCRPDPNGRLQDIRYNAYLMHKKPLSFTRNFEELDQIMQLAVAHMAQALAVILRQWLIESRQGLLASGSDAHRDNPPVVAVAAAG